MSLITDHFSSSGSVKVKPVDSQSKNTLISKHFTVSSPVEIKTPEKTSLFDKIKQKIGGVAKGVAQFGARMGIEALNMGTSLVDTTSDLLNSTIEAKIRSKKIFTPKASLLADKWKSFYENNSGELTEKAKLFTDNLRNVEFIQPSKEWSEDSTKNKLTKRLPETILNIGPGVVASLGSFALNPALGLLASIGSTANEITDIAEKSGVKKENAQLLGLGTGFLVAKLDSIVPDELFSPGQKKEFVGSLVKRVFKTGLKEATTEVVQEDVQLAVEATLRDDLGWDEVKTRNAMAGLGGLLGGTGASTTVSFLNNIKSGDIGGLEPVDFQSIKVEESEPVVTEPIKRTRISVREQYDGAKTAVATVRPDGTGSISVVLAKESQNKGIGSKIVDDLEQRLAKQGVTKVELKSFDESTEFWKKKGYVEAGEAKNGIVPMTKTISVQTGVVDMNKEQNQKNSQKVISDTTSGKREEFRLDSQEKITKNSGMVDVKPDDTVVVYRADKENGEINNAVYVTTSKEKAQKEYLGKREGSKLIEKEVKISDLVRADGTKNEFIYSPKAIDENTSRDEITKEKIKATNDEKSVKSTLKHIQKQLSEVTVEAQARSEMAKYQRDGINTKNVAKLKGIIAINKKFQEGDIETIRNSSSGELLNSVLENIQEVHPEMSEDEAFDYALSLPTKADENSRTSEVVDLEKREKTLRKFMDQLKARQEELGIKESEILSEEWSKALAEQEALMRVIKVSTNQMPVGEGKLKVSRLEARVYGKLKGLSVAEQEKIGLSTFRQMNKKENVAKAVKYVTENPKDALRVIKGEIEPPEGILVNSIYVAMKELGSVDADIALKVASLKSTRAGQELSVLSEIDKDSPVSLMEDLAKTRIEAYEKKSGRNSKAKIKSEVAKIDEEIKAPSTRQWDSFLKEVLC
jgi:GNAT superfamily N-acetyltransferase